MTDRLTGDEDFPLVRELTYLSTASVGLVPESVQTDARRFDRDVSSRGTTWFDEVEELRVLDGARAAAASLFSVSEDEIAVVSSATELLCQLAWHVRPVAGENVVSLDCEFPSAHYGIQCRRLRASGPALELSAEDRFDSTRALLRADRENERTPLDLAVNRCPPPP